MIRPVALAAAALVLTGCGGISGEVIAKDYQPGYYTPATRTVWRDDCRTITRRTSYTTGTGTNRRTVYGATTNRECSRIPVGTETYQSWHGSCHRVTVRRDDDKTESRCVSETKYYSVEIGSKVEDW